MFDHPVCLEQGKTYEIVSLMNGPSSWRVVQGKNSDEVEGIQFSFSSPASSGNGTDVRLGQFPSFIFSSMSFLVRETRDFGPYLPVSRLASDISWIV